MNVSSSPCSCAESERRLARVIRLQCFALGLLGALLVAGFFSQEPERAGPETLERLRVRELVVVDSNGVERARLGGNLPDAVVAGRRLSRGELAAGLLLYDGAGQERGGYVTFEPSGNVALTLDSRKGQTALFVAGPEGATALKLWTGTDSIELRSDDDGARWTVAEDGHVLLQEPPIALGREACAGYREALEHYSREDVMRACRERYSEAACQACLDSR